jgi:hypothetical protein
MEGNRILDYKNRPFQAAAILFFIIGWFLLHAGSDPVCDYQAPNCEPDALDELGYDFLEVTGIPEYWTGTIGIMMIGVVFVCLLRDREAQKNEEIENLPELPTEEMTPRSAEQVQQLYENLGLETTKEPADESPNWWED